jgi:hypothetical protein
MCGLSNKVESILHLSLGNAKSLLLSDKVTALMVEVRSLKC